MSTQTQTSNTKTYVSKCEKIVDTFRPKMTCCLCARTHEARVVAEKSSVETVVLPDTGSPEAHHLEEAILFNQAAKGKHLQWRKKRYWLAGIPTLKAKCCPSVIASLSVALQKPIGIVNTRLRQSCVFLNELGIKPLCLCCGLDLLRRDRLLLLVHRGAYVFAVNHRHHRVNMKALRLCVRQLIV